MLSGSFGFVLFLSGVPSDRRVHSASRGFTLVRLGVDRFIRVLPTGRPVHSGSRGFTRVRLGSSSSYDVRVCSLEHA